MPLSKKRLVSLGFSQNDAAALLEIESRTGGGVSIITADDIQALLLTVNENTRIRHLENRLGQLETFLMSQSNIEDTELKRKVDQLEVMLWQIQ